MTAVKQKVCHHNSDDDDDDDDDEINNDGGDVCVVCEGVDVYEWRRPLSQLTCWSLSTNTQRTSQ